VGVTLVTVGVGAITVNPGDRVSLPPPAAAGLVTVTVYAAGVSDVFGHQNRSCVLAINTYGVLALAELPDTVAPERLPTVIVAPSAKPVPVIVTWLLGVTP
jgi:hypothetical protein